VLKGGVDCNANWQAAVCSKCAVCCDTAAAAGVVWPAIHSTTICCSAELGRILGLERKWIQTVPVPILS